MKAVTIAVVLSAIFSMSCHSKMKQMEHQHTVLQEGAMVTLKGVYTKSVMSQKPGNNSYGHYKIVVNDTLSVNLLPPYEKESVRPEPEVAEMEGKLVEVAGVFSDRTYMEQPGIDHDAQWVNTPCFTSIEHIRLVK